MNTKPADSTQLNERLSQALVDENATTSVITLIMELSRNGILKKDLVELVSTRHALAQKEKHLWKEEAVLGDVLDMMTGFFVPNPQNIEQIQFTEHFRES